MTDLTNSRPEATPENASVLSDRGIASVVGPVERPDLAVERLSVAARLAALVELMLATLSNAYSAAEATALESSISWSYARAKSMVPANRIISRGAMSASSTAAVPSRRPRQRPMP